jgi:nucleoside-diphosphate-sugar epimerase
MSRHAIVIGATGQVGRATIANLTEHGWSVTAVHRGSQTAPAQWREHGVEVRHADRDDTAQLAAAVGSGGDLVIDAVAYGDAHGRQLVDLAGDVGSIVVISTAGVYVDAAGRPFPGTPDELPEFPVPIGEDQPTVAPGPDSYPTAKIALERVLLDTSPAPVTVVRPGAIHGPGSGSPREWWPLKRALDRRPAIPLAFGGRSRFHTSSAVNLAELIRLAAERPASRVLHGADPAADDVATLVRTICATTDHQPELVPFEGWPPDSKAGSSPWSLAMPLVLDMTAAETELGYRPVQSYAEAVVDTCAWLRSTTAGRRWEEALPELPALYGDRLFDYDAEDRLLATLRADGSTSGGSREMVRD